MPPYPSDAQPSAGMCDVTRPYLLGHNPTLLASLPQRCFTSYPSDAQPSAPSGSTFGGLETPPEPSSPPPPLSASNERPTRTPRGGGGESRSSICSSCAAVTFASGLRVYVFGEISYIYVYTRYVSDTCMYMYICMYIYVNMYIVS